MKNLKAYIVAGVLILVFVLYLVFTQSNSSTLNANIQQPAPTSSPSGSSTSSASGSNPPAGSGSSSSSGSETSGAGGSSGSDTGQYKDGTYTGSVADAFYGNLQVQAVVQGGKLTDVAFLQYPNDSGHSSEVSSMALPILKSEAITSQNAQVNIVSGATQTSEAFQQSLAAALTQAH